ncbi:MAG: M20/M25/M40 family metallo-hydrolase, partial [Gluconacetobacter diazotrophicus]|nr:M20/M25/M40 family metallo-hydrolase [Gluconacetobacter diazotrophicus]
MEDAAARAERWATLLTERRSVSGTDGEAGFAAFLRDLVRGSPAFAGRPEDVWLLPVPGGRHPRHCVLALVRGRGPDTVVLTGHFDTVGTADFGALEPVATDPAALRRALPAMPGVDERAAAEIASGRFVPGRGLLDMKAGLAAMLVALEEHAAAGVPSGNLLFVAVPDEEVDSAGARAAAAALPEVARERGLRLLAAINGDAIADDGDGEAGRAVCLGTVGKLCPAVLVVGRPVHAGYSFRGINALALAGAIAAEMEWEPELAEANEDGGERAGPTLLGMGDGRERYDVTTPGTAWLYWNVITRHAGAGDVLDAVERAAARATEAMSRRLAERRRQATGAGAELPPVRVLRYSALAAEVRRARPDDGMAILAALGSELAAAGLPLPEQCRRLCVRAVELCGLDGPAVVVALASVPYLPTTLRAPAM